MKRCPAGESPRPAIREVKDLPGPAREYLNFISDQLQVEIGMISTGPERDATIVPQGTNWLVVITWLSSGPEPGDLFHAFR